MSQKRTSLSKNPLQETAAPRRGTETTTGAAELIEVASIRAYERNPRRGNNPEYDRIKESIRAHGMDQPLVITRRPGETEYMVHSGGNTRLQIVRELYEETGDENFSRILCLVRPWTCESDVLLAHLRENDLRGGLTFIDKARAVASAGELLAEELSIGTVTQERLGDELKKAGYQIHRSLISRMKYAVDTLLPLIPQALESGLGKHQVERIRALQRGARDLWHNCCLDSEDKFETVFAELCKRYDGPVWDTDLLQSAIETEIAEESELGIHSVRVALDAALHGRDIVFPEVGPDPTPAPAPDPEPDPSGHAPKDEMPRTADNVAQKDQASHTGPLEMSVSEVPSDLKSLRARAWTLAERLAQRNGMAELVLPLSGRGLGFVLRDVPDPALAEQLDEDTLSQISMLWWQLAACSEMTFAPLDAILVELPGDSVLRRALQEQNASLLFKSVWTLDPGHTGYRLWRTLHNRDWCDLVCLMDTYRRIRNLAAKTGAPIWEQGA